MPYKLSTMGEHALKNEEGLRLTVYYCASNKATIGYGTRWYPGMPTKITIEQAQAYFDKYVKTILDNLWALNKTLSQGEVDALVSFIYNIGLNAWNGSTARALLVKDKLADIPRQLIRWVHDDHGKVIEGLVNRRRREIAIFNKGV